MINIYKHSLLWAVCLLTFTPGVNIFFERDPSIEPADACEDPSSTTVIKCVFWGGYVADESANNNGQWRNQFHVVIAGSNGYQKTGVPTIDGYSGVYLGNAAINAPLDNNNEDTYLGVRVLTRSYFDPALCKAACEAYNDDTLAHSDNPKTCQFFTTYIAALNGRPEGQVCALYHKGWDKSYATNVVSEHSNSLRLGRPSANATALYRASTAARTTSPSATASPTGTTPTPASLSSSSKLRSMKKVEDEGFSY